MDGHYQYNMQDNEGESQQTHGEEGEDGYPYQSDYTGQEEDAASDVTEGHDEEDQMYEGEYQGIPHPDEIKEARRAARREARLKAKLASLESEETLAEQYESIMEDCGHGRFQWTLFTVLGLALMADGVECFVVAFALPSAEKDMCLSNANKGMLDLEKAYDRVPREELWYCMRKSGVAEKYVRVVQDMYERSRTVVRCAVGQTKEFNVEVGLHQGSALSPFLFAIVMDQLSEEVRQESPWTMMFADDIVICSESREQVEENLERWRFALERRGMKVSRSKTEYMCVNEREGSGTVRLQGEEVKKVQEFKYLGSTVQSNGECAKEVKKRVQAGWNGWRKVSGVLCERKISARIKGKVYRTVVRPAMLYGLETVSLRKRQESELEVAELKMLRFSLGVTRLDRIRNEYIRGTAHVGRLGDKLREARLRWFGHVQRRESLIVYVGMMLGAVVWGGLADKLGRRQCLLNALAINCIFSFVSSFAQGYGFFLFCRLCSGIGIGGSIPIVYTYFAEFLHMDKRGEHLSWLCLFWMLGGLYASFSAWGIIPHYGWGFSMGTEFQFHSWRVFVLVCFLPAVAALAGLVFMPESPRYLLENARHDEAWMILRRVHDTNWRAKGEPERVFQVSQFKTPQTEEDDFIEIQSETGTAFQRFMVRQMTLVKQVMKNLMSLAGPKLRLHGLFIAIVWFTMAFGYYGLSVWFPDQIKHLQYEEYESKTQIFMNDKIEYFHFNFSLKNQIHQEGHYNHDWFVGIEITNVRFKDALFQHCYFEDIKSTDTLFENCTIINSVFYNTDLWPDSKFIDCNFINVTFSHPKSGCHLNFQEENDILIYLVSFLGSLSVLPGNIIAGFLMDKIGRIKIIGSSMLVSSGCTFFLFLCFSPGAVITFQCLFYAASAAAWNGIEVLTVELYPASKRATAFGVLNSLSKLAAIISTFVFSKFVGITKIIPIILSFSAMACGGLLSFKLPETREVILQ
ncbi:hypothetical protein QTP70_023968 [Hemibagrus guttatus]|uniref:ribonuclease H n=1 Tax=Hemibagrus guttatus TaxID=175788 RepID=A0AAE0QVI2_9TELE|nr:hypothetical protein QTP70_023968 [Hemibagrus guttatus]